MISKEEMLETVKKQLAIIIVMLMILIKTELL